MARIGVFIVLVAFLGAVTAQAQAGYGYGGYPGPTPPTTSPPTKTPPPPAGPPLRLDFYKYSCPKAKAIVSKVIRNATVGNPGVGAGLVRMAFHDCFVLWFTLCYA
ncbi:hypothetical protein ACP70R_047743 [Stipagrostis hirtigluma subsp. patula]